MADPAAPIADLAWWECAARLAGACACGGALGFDREARGRPAGLRTHMLVAVGAAGFVVLAVRVASGQLLGDGAAAGVDLTRVVAAVVGGIGFLGAGAIIQSGGNVRGLTTAAGLWLTAAIGVALGLGDVTTGVTLTVIGVVVISLLRLIEPGIGAVDGRSDAGGDQAD